jgi:peptidoglycan/xylan/chitin deacetylase (PgdA/CDA1 family)
MPCRSRPRAARPAALLAALIAVSGSSTAPGAASGPPVPILAYHHIGSAPRGTSNPSLWVRRSLFDRQLLALDRAGYEAVTLDRVWRAWHGDGALPAHPFVISFDDGYSGQAATVAPLRAHGWPGVLNLQVGRLGSRGGLTRAQVRAMIAAGWEIDAHSITHPDLRTVSAKRLRHEVAGSREAIRRAFGVPVDFFAYPYGRNDARVRAAVRRAGFLAATTIARGLARPDADPFALGRVLVGADDSPSSVLRMVRTGG